MMHNHNFPGAADDVPTIETLWEEAKAARRALINLPLETPEPEAEPYHDRCSRLEDVINCLAATTAREIAVHLRIYLGRNEQSASGESLAFDLVPFDDRESIAGMAPAYVPVWRFICELEGRELPDRS
jgi:hypothetical protein